MKKSEGVKESMRKENIVIVEPVKVVIRKDILKEISLESLEKAYPELRFVPGSTPDEKEEMTFFIGQPPSEKHPFSVEETILKDPMAFWDYKRRIMAYTWLRKLPMDHRRELYEAWYILKFLCQEILNTKARKLGREMAALPESTSADVLEHYRDEILSILPLPSGYARIRNSLWKNYSNQLKKTKRPIDAIKTPEDPSGEETLLEELKILEKEALETRLFFGTSPILYKENSLTHTEN